MTQLNMSEEQRRASQIAEIKRSVAEHWGDAIAAVGAPLEKAVGLAAMGAAPRGWRAPCAQAMGEAVKKGILSQFAALERERDPQGHV